MVVGICRCKDEADIIEATVEHMLTQVDHVLIADNASTDGTFEILGGLLDRHPDRMTLKLDAELGYFQARQMTVLAADAGQMGAAWVVPFDADEVWYSPFGRIADVLAENPQASIATADLYDHVATGQDPDDDPVSRIGWRRRKPAPLPKVAAVPYPRVRIHQGNHGADYGETLSGQLVVRHFPYRSAEQFERKVRNGAAAYAATDLPDDIGKHWRDYGRILEAEGPEALASVFRSWFWVDKPERDPSLMFDPAPCPVRS